MELWTAAKYAAFIALSAYFVSRVVTSLEKLAENTIGTATEVIPIIFNTGRIYYYVLSSFQRAHSKSFLFPSISVCMLKAGEFGTFQGERAAALRTPLNISDLLLYLRYSTQPIGYALVYHQASLLAY